MSENTNGTASLDDLRRRAEELARELDPEEPENLAAQSPEETQKVLYELRVHQIELEMQNEELRQAQEQLETSRARYFELYDLAPVGYLSMSEQGLIVEANLTFAAMLQLRRAKGSLFGQPLTRFILPEDQDIFYLHRKPLFETGAPQVCELRMLREDGSPFWTRLEARAANDMDGTSLCRIIVSDITEQRRSEDERAKLQEQFNQAQKMETVGRLAGGVAHDLNNLLTPILGYGELLLSDPDPGDACREHVGEMVHAAERARDLVRQLLAFSRKQVGEFKLIDLNETAEGFATLLRRTIRADIAIKSASGAASCILADRGQLEQAIMNLAVNAQDAMPEGGILTIETSVVNVDETRATAVEGLVPGRYSLLTISDTGQGMDAETRTHLFEPFFTTKGTGEGTGLGLATVYGIVKQHGGRISVYSEPGLGTTFNIYLPSVEGQAGQAEETPANFLDKDLHGIESILLVEDSLQVRDLAQAVLERLGYTVLVASTAAEALEALGRDHARIHLVLTDVIMPGINGRDLLARVSKTYPRIRGLLMSGYNEDTASHRGMLDEGMNFLQKPFTVEALARKVRETLDA